MLFFLNDKINEEDFLIYFELSLFYNYFQKRKNNEGRGKNNEEKGGGEGRGEGEGRGVSKKRT